MHLMPFTLIDSKEEPVSYLYYASVKKDLFCPLFLPSHTLRKCKQTRTTQTPKRSTYSFT